jgi:hypothetical protein
MSVPVAVQAAYDATVDSLRQLEAIVGQTIQHWASANDYLFKGRIKDAQSLSEKLETGRFATWPEIDDLYACTVVIPTAGHVERVLGFLRAAFREREIRGQGVSQKAPDVFRFDAPRFIGTLTPQEGVERPAGLDDVLFEVQILTAFEYAWVVATHDLVYKGGHVDWRRARLAAYLKAAAEEADALITSFELTAESIPLSPHTATNRRERIAEFFKAEFEAGRIPTPLEPASWARFCENVSDLIHTYARDRFDEELDLLRADVQALLTSGGAPVSGSLFQLVVGLVNGRLGSDALRRFVIVDSSELRDLYGVTEIPRAFALPASEA